MMSWRCRYMLPVLSYQWVYWTLQVHPIINDIEKIEIVFQIFLILVDIWQCSLENWIPLHRAEDSWTLNQGAPFDNFISSLILTCFSFTGHGSMIQKGSSIAGTIELQDIAHLDLLLSYSIISMLGPKLSVKMCGLIIRLVVAQWR